jgi:coenzyme F420 hydrogenase subunit beta
VDFVAISQRLFGSSVPDDVLGCHLCSYVGAVSDANVRRRRSSGGLATEAAIWGLQTQRWQGVIVSRLAQQRPFDVETYLATTAKEVRSAANSLYRPVPACTGWAAIKDFGGPVCFVGLPCHIEALRKAQERVPWLRERVAFAIGLFCSGTPGTFATEAFLRYHGIMPGRVTSLEYRCEGWPGTMRVQVRDRRTPRRFHRGQRGGLADRFRFMGAFQRRGAFVHPRCLTCPDHVAELADLSLGDAWHVVDRRETLGRNLAIVRSEQAAQLLREMHGANRIFLAPIPREKVIHSQQACLASQKRLASMTAVLRKRHIPTPTFTGLPNLRVNRPDRWMAWLEWGQTRLASRRGAWWLLPLLAGVTAVLRRLCDTSVEASPRTAGSRIQPGEDGSA